MKTGHVLKGGCLEKWRVYRYSFGTGHCPLDNGQKLTNWTMDMYGSMKDLYFFLACCNATV